MSTKALKISGDSLNVDAEHLHFESVSISLSKKGSITLRNVYGSVMNLHTENGDIAIVSGGYAMDLNYTVSHQNYCLSSSNVTEIAEGNSLPMRPRVASTRRQRQIRESQDRVSARQNSTTSRHITGKIRDAGAI